MKNPKRAIIYARCSTDEKKQDVQSQIDVCVRHCVANEWEYEVVFEYESAYQKGKKRKVFDETLKRIRLKEFNILIVYMLDRFSRQTPTKIVSDLHKIVEDYGCRFISAKEGIDSSQEMWEMAMMCFAYMANNYSKMLGVRVKEGIARKKELGKYGGGAPRKKVNEGEIVALRGSGLGLRTIAKQYNEGKKKKERISYQYVKRVLQKRSEDLTCNNDAVLAVT